MACQARENFKTRRGQALGFLHSASAQEQVVYAVEHPAPAGRSSSSTLILEVCKQWDPDLLVCKTRAFFGYRPAEKWDS